MFPTEVARTGPRWPVRHVAARMILVYHHFTVPLSGIRSVRAQAVLKGDLRLLPFLPSWLVMVY